MKDIVYNPGDNTGSILEILFIPASHISTIPDAVGSEILEAVTLVSGKQWFKACLGAASKKGFMDEAAESDNGTYYKKKIMGFVSTDDDTNNDNFSEMENERFVCITKDREGRTRLVGSKEQPLFFSSTYNTQNEITGLKGHVISWYGTGSHRSCLYQIDEPLRLE